MRNIKIALIIDEYFGGGGTAYGGYGFIARHYIAKYIPNANIQIDVIIGTGHSKSKVREEKVDGISLFWLPQKDKAALKWLENQNYDLFFSIEVTYGRIFYLARKFERKLLLWIQDPRPWYEWREINTVKLFPESCYYNQELYDYVNEWYKNNKVSFLSQAYFLNNKAKDLYRLDDEVDIHYLPNPVDIPDTLNLEIKGNSILFLGRLESVKRGWLFCEIAKQLPQYNFYVLGKTTREASKNKKVLEPYQNLPNLHFVGHVEGELKDKYLSEAKLLINTSIHEGLPGSFLEALAHGTLLVSNRNPENLTAQFGIWTGQINGDGFEDVHKYVSAVKTLMEDYTLCKRLASNGYEYVKRVHNIASYVNNLRMALYANINHELGSSPYSIYADKVYKWAGITWLTVSKVKTKIIFRLLGVAPFIKISPQDCRFFNLFRANSNSPLKRWVEKLIKYLDV